MDSFSYRDHEYNCEGVPLSTIASDYHTPAYVYSQQTIVNHCRVFREAFSVSPGTTGFFAVKSCSNLTLLRLIFSQGFGADVVSLGEYRRSRLAGCAAENIVFSGVGKTDEELRCVLTEGIHSIHVESFGELVRLDNLAKAIARETWISLRVNPDIDAKTHPKISTGLKDTKFGVPAVDFEKSCLFIKKSGWLKIVGLSCHIGSQIAETGPIFAATKKMAAMVKSLLDLGFSDIKYLDMGGGFGIRYRDENPAPLIECAEGMSEIMKDLPVKLYLEPGRVLVGNSAILLTRVIDIKAAETKSFIVVDASMSELMRPSLYDAYHEIVPVQKRAGLPTQRKEGELHSGIFDVVGPVCESADVLGVNRKFEHIAVGDLLAIRTAGAYGMSMASNYNSRPRPCEVLVDGSTSKLVRRREGFSDLVAHEIFEP